VSVDRAVLDLSLPDAARRRLATSRGATTNLTP
jgi:hypothetical protein